MKEAAGEANLTVVAIILIAVVVAVATPLISSLMKGSAAKACCTDAGGKWSGGKCVDAGSGMLDCEGFKTCVTDAGQSDKANSCGNAGTGK